MVSLSSLSYYVGCVMRSSNEMGVRYEMENCDRLCLVDIRKFPQKSVKEIQG